MDMKSTAPTSEPPFERVHLPASQQELIALHRHVLRHGKRVEIMDDTGGKTVLIAGTELEALETALELLGKTDEVRALHLEVARLAAASMNAA